MHSADIQDRDGGVLVMATLFGLHPFLLKLYADGGYQGANFQAGLRTTCRQINLEIVKRSELRKFVVLPKRWIVERTIAWLNRCRRLARDWECLNRRAPAFLRPVGLGDEVVRRLVGGLDPPEFDPGGQTRPSTQQCFELGRPEAIRVA